MSDLTYAGKTFRFSVDNGTVFRNTYAADGAGLRFETPSGPDAGLIEDVVLHVAEVAAGIFLIGWTEKSGIVVTHAMNLNTSTVHAFWAYETPQGRVGELDTGTLEAL